MLNAIENGTWKARPMQTDPRVVEAVNHLVSAPNYVALVTEMTRIIENWDMHPMYYGGAHSCLNALVDVGLHSREAFERLVQLAADRRKEKPATRRVDYQRELMRERRAREAKALELQELTIGHVLRGSARIAYIEGVRSRWNVAKDEYIKAKGDLTWSERNAATREFWAEIDERLDANLAEARKKRLRA